LDFVLVLAQTGNGRFLAYYGKIILMPEILMGSNHCIQRDIQNHKETPALALGIS
jgi:hypothetical protein